MKIAIVSSGLGVVRRGFESAAGQWADALRSHSMMDVELYSGGRHPGALKLPCITQNSFLVRLGKKLGCINDGVGLQQKTIFPALRMALAKSKPDFVWLQEWILARRLQGWVRKAGIKTKVVFCNGAPMGAADCLDFDLLVTLHDVSRQESLAAGQVEAKCITIPHPLPPKSWNPTKAEARQHLGLSVDEKVLLCAAAWNKHHKRIHHLLEETAICKRRDFNVLLCGQREAETAELQELGQRLLPGRTHWHTLPPAEMQAAYAAADAFTLCSVKEGLPGVLVESAAAGLPVLAHRMPSSEFVFGVDYAGLLDMEERGMLAGRIDRLFDEPAFAEALRKAGVHVKEEFSANNLAFRLEAFLRGHAG